jgi:hypothetical protein
MAAVTTEPRVRHATVRDAITDGVPELHIECRFSDGQKFAAIVVDGEFKILAFQIAHFLNEAAHAAGE